MLKPVSVADEMIVPVGRDGRPRPLRPFRLRPASTLKDQHKSNLELVGEAFARSWAISLAAQTRSEIKIALSAVSPWAWADVLAVLPEPGCGAPMNVPPLEQPGVFTCDLALAMGIVDRMLGGPGSGKLPPRPLTDVETKLMRDVAQRAMGDLALALAIIVPTEPEVIQQESRLQLIKAASPEAQLLVLTFMVTVGQAEGEMMVGLPAESLIARLDAFVGTGPPPITLGSISGPLLDAAIELQLCFNPVSLCPGDIVELSIGDVLSLPHPVGDPLTLWAGGRACLSAIAGRRGSRLACAIVDPTSGAQE